MNLIRDINDELVYINKDLMSSLEYVTFVLGRELIKVNILSENDIAYDLCRKIAKDFVLSHYNVNTKGLYECLEEYVKACFHLSDGILTWKGKKYEI